MGLIDWHRNRKRNFTLFTPPHQCAVTMETWYGGKTKPTQQGPPGTEQNVAPLATRLVDNLSVVIPSKTEPNAVLSSLFSYYFEQAQATPGTTTTPCLTHPLLRSIL